MKKIVFVFLCLIITVSLTSLVCGSEAKAATTKKLLTFP